VRFPGDAVLFDLDGTLVDTAADLCGALNRALQSVGRPPVTVQQVRGMIGGGLPNLVMKGLEATGGPIPTDQYEEIVKNARLDYEEHVADQSKPYPGVLEALRGLAQRGSKMGVCTNKPAAASKKLLAALGLDKYLSVIVGGDSLPVKKPHPQMAREVLKKLGNIAPEAAVLVGDSETDVKLARAANLPVILVDGGYTEIPVKDLGADLVIRSFAQLNEKLAPPSH
jgi:phosphoglycolate phosphatase